MVFGRFPPPISEQKQGCATCLKGRSQKRSNRANAEVQETPVNTSAIKGFQKGQKTVFDLECRCSIQLSYGRTLKIRHLRVPFLALRKSCPKIVPRSTKNGNPVLLSMTKTEQQIDRPSVWERTRYQRLFRYVPSGTIFARFKIRGKQVRKSLKTTNLEMAKNKLAGLERNESAIAYERRREKMLFGQIRYIIPKSLMPPPPPARRVARTAGR